MFISCSQQLEYKPPVISGLYPVLPARGTVKLVYSLEHDKDVPVVIDIDYLANDGKWHTASAAQGSISGLINGYTSGSEQAFLWDSYSDLSTTEFETQLRLTATTPFGTSKGNTESFILQNSNLPPEIIYTSLKSDTESGSVEISLTVIDEENENVNLAIYYSTDSTESWNNATLTKYDYDLSGSHEGENYQLTWLAIEDIGLQTPVSVQLKAIASDSLGKGDAFISDKFNLDFEYSSGIIISNFNQSSLKGDVPIAFKLFGNSTDKFNVQISYTSSTNPEGSIASASLRYLNKLINLSASPEGTIYYFFWDSKNDIEQTIDNNVKILINMLDTDNQEFDPLLTDTSLTFRVNNAKVVTGPLISEIYSGINGKGAFIELYGPPGHSLDQYRLYEKWDGSKNGQVTGTAYLQFPESSFINENGLYVIGSKDVANVDIVPLKFETFFGHSSEAYTLVLNIDEGDASETAYDYDAVGIGDFSQSGFQSQGEGEPVDVPPMQKSINRDFTNTDMNDNKSDFIFLDPNPGQAHIWQGD